MLRNTSMLEGRAPSERVPGPSRAALGRAVEAMRACADALSDLASALDRGKKRPQAELMVATTAILGAGQAAAELLDLVAPANTGMRPSPKYMVTCPECGAQTVTEWTDALPPGGVSPVACSACGHMILSESEGDPVPVTDAPELDTAACASSAGALDGRSV